jgi:hypothetical protein
VKLLVGEQKVACLGLPGIALKIADLATRFLN